MRFTFKRTIKIELEGEYPLLGYDVKKAIQSQFGDSLDEVVELSKNVSDTTQKIDIKGKTYYLTVNDEIYSIK